MALTHKFLKALGIDAEQVELIITEHQNTLADIKKDKDEAVEQANKYKEDAEKLKTVQTELDKYKDADKNYKELKAEYEKYKGEQAAKETKANKTKAFKKLLADMKVSEKWHDRVVKGTDLDGVELDENGAIKDVEALKKSITDEWGDCIETTGATGADTKTPPKNNGGKMTKDEIMSIADDKERQMAIAENHELFGF